MVVRRGKSTRCACPRAVPTAAAPERQPGQARRMQPDQDEPVFCRRAVWLMGDEAGSGCSVVLFTPEDAEGPEDPEKERPERTHRTQNIPNLQSTAFPLTHLGLRRTMGPYYLRLIFYLFTGSGNRFI